MCAIFGSYSIVKLTELAELNSYRGQHSFSFAEYNTVTKELNMRRKCLGAFSLDGLEISRGMYYISHIQDEGTCD